MAFNLFNGYQNPYQQALQQQYQQLAQNVQPQEYGFVRVQSEEQAREWKVAPGNSVTFINDTAPYCYTKSMGLSQFDTPVFRKFRLEEEAVTEARKSPNLEQSEKEYNYLTPDDIEPIKAKIKQIEAFMEEIRKEGRKNEPTHPESDSAERSE